MTQALVKHVIVKEGGKIELQSPDLHEGQKAEVIVLLEEGKASPKKSSTFSAMLGHGKGLFKSADEVDAYIRAERDSWQS